MKPIVTVHSWFAIGYKYKFIVCENLIKTSFVVIFCFILVDFNMSQKLPEVLDLGDIDLDRKRLRKQLQVVRIRKLYLAAIYNTSFFFKEKKGQNPSHQHHVSHCFCRFPKKFRTWFSRTTRRTPGNSSEWWTSRGLYNTPLLSVPMAGGVSVFFSFFFYSKANANVFKMCFNVISDISNTWSDIYMYICGACNN